MSRMIGSHVWFVWKNLEEYLPETMLMRQDCFVGFCVCVIKVKMASLRFYE